MSQEQFLSNYANKQRLIFILRIKLENKNCIVKQTVEDADTLIVHSTIEISNSTERIVMVGEDTDRFVLLSSSNPFIFNQHLFFEAKNRKIEPFIL